jgi:hypothetical protein
MHTFFAAQKWSHISGRTDAQLRTMSKRELAVLAERVCIPRAQRKRRPIAQLSPFTPASRIAAMHLDGAERSSTINRYTHSCRTYRQSPTDTTTNAVSLTRNGKRAKIMFP